MKTHHITQEAPKHIPLFASFLCCYQATWSYKGRRKRGAGERTCVGRGERCVKIKGCRLSKEMCMTLFTQYPKSKSKSSSIRFAGGPGDQIHFMQNSSWKQQTCRLRMVNFLKLPLTTNLPWMKLINTVIHAVRAWKSWWSVFGCGSSQQTCWMMFVPQQLHGKWLMKAHNDKMQCNLM